MTRMKLTALLFILFLRPLFAYKVLIIFPTPSLSHQLPIMALTEGLMTKGHQVTVISTDAVPAVPGLLENYTFVDMSFTYQYFSPEEKNDEAVDFQKQISKRDLTQIFLKLGGIVNKQLESDQFLQFTRKVHDEKLIFDVIICESYLTPYGVGIARILGQPGPIIAFFTASIDPFVEEYLGSLRHLSYTPGLFESFTDKMNLWQKIENWVSDRYIVKNWETAITDTAVNFFSKNYGAEYKEFVREFKSKVCLLLLSSNFLYNYPRALTPNVIELGAMHIKPPKKLPKELQDWCDGAEKGVVYMSLGSNMKSKSLPESVRSNFLRVFKELPVGYRVLWKWELDSLIPGQSNNILAQKWMPQQSVFAHPKVKAFITQGGLQSFQESVHHGVPTIGIPWYSDQELNVAKMVDAGIGVRLGPRELFSYKKIKSAIESVLFNESYSKNMKKLSAISQEFTSSAEDKAVFWVEHVARYGGAPHLRPSTADTTYFQYFCLDILSVFLVFSVVLIYTLILVCKFIISVLFSPSKKLKTI